MNKLARDAIKLHFKIIRKQQNQINDYAKALIPDFNDIFRQVLDFDCEKSPIGLCVFELTDKGLPDRCNYCYLSVDRNK